MYENGKRRWRWKIEIGVGVGALYEPQQLPEKTWFDVDIGMAHNLLVVENGTVIECWKTRPRGAVVFYATYSSGLGLIGVVANGIPSTTKYTPYPCWLVCVG